MFQEKREDEDLQALKTALTYRYIQGVGIEFGLEKSALLVKKSGKLHLTDEIELPNKDKIRKLAENETYK